MDLSSLPEPWGTVFELIVGPVGAIVVLCVVIYFLWRLFREEQQENRASMRAVDALAQTVADLKDELKIWREASK